MQIPGDVLTLPGFAPGVYSAGYNTLGKVLVLTAQARIASLDARDGEAVALLSAAVELETGLGYTEPPRLHHPTRHCLTHLLLRSQLWQVRAVQYFWKPQTDGQVPL